MKNRYNWLIHLILIIGCAIVMFPVVFAVIKATQTRSAVLTPSLVPGTEFFTNLRAVWVEASLWKFMRNSFVVAIAVTIGKTILSLFAGMALVYFRFPAKRFIFGFILLTLMMPTEVLLVPLFDLVSQRPPASWEAFWLWFRDPRHVFLEPSPFGFGWANTYWAIIVPFLASATGTFLFRQHFMAIPQSLADAARIDGATPFQFLSRILVPMSVNTIGALAVIQFVYVWDQYLWPKVIIRREDYQVVQVGLNLIIGTGEGVQWGYVMAGALLTLIPPLLVFALLQEQFMRGFALSESK
ncbi:MAG: carbohydrate ABC transporter permease [Trueperaceae bacterium]|nr:carbohydrate ABC transporter permease [Trueperaceae bacterium]